ncbi:MAG TPA: GNAT family protein [Alphaproteobacteria bacterium]|nr:GNAT family protein [Alphaproteobacteria bacterium]
MGLGLVSRTSRQDGVTVLKGERVTLRSPVPDDYEEWAALRDTSRDFLIPWEPTWASDELTRAAYKRRLRQYAADSRDGLGYAFFVLRSNDLALLGSITLFGVTRGVSQCCSVGYWLGRAYAGRGYMSDALKTIMPFVFDTLGLHRLEAACIPDNEASRLLLLHNGFRQEGYARQYLKINGRWRDHLLFSRLESDPPLR